MSVTAPAISRYVVAPKTYVARSGSGADHVPPPSVLRVIPGWCTSKGSPNPRKRMSGFDGSMASVPTVVVPKASVIGSHCTAGERALYVFQTPPPEVAR